MQRLATTCLYGYGYDVSNAKQLFSKLMYWDSVYVEKVSVGTNAAGPIVRSLFDKFKILNIEK